MLERPNITEGIAHFVANTGAADIPDRVYHEAKRALMSFFAVALTGSGTRPVEIALKSLAEFSGGAPATVIGRSERIDALSAAFLNAASANIYDYCDTHLPTVIHPTSPLAPALFAMSQLMPVTGQQLLLSFVTGFEVQCRIGRVFSPGHYGRGWHITSTCGVFGAATGASRLLSLDARRIVWALGNASTQSSGLCQCLGWPAKSISVGNAARNGLWSALLASKGFEGPPEPLSGVQGYFHAMSDTPDWRPLTQSWGDDWELLDNSIKPYPCGFVIHPFLDCVLDWRRDNPGKTVERLVLHGNPLLIQRTDRPNISTGREAQVSVQHAVAAALTVGSISVDQFTDECALDPAVVKLREKIEVVEDANISIIAGDIELWTTEGTKHSLSTKAARGSSSNPLTDEQVEAKLRHSADGRISNDNTQRLIDEVWRLEASKNVAGLLTLAVPDR